MNYPDRAPRWRRYLRLLRPDVQADVDDELRFHFDSRVEELVKLGESPSSAHALAAREFGDVHEIRRGLVTIDKRVAAQRSRVEMLRDAAADVRYAIRSLMRTPGAAIAILLTLGLGVGANAAMFTLLETIFVRPPAGVVDPGGVRRVWRLLPMSDGVQFHPRYSYVQFRAISSAVGHRGAVAIFAAPFKRKIGFGESAVQAEVSYASAGFFSLLGVHPGVGRLYSTDEDRLDGHDHVVVLSHDYWTRTYGANPAVIGSTIVVAAQKCTIVGVAQPGFTGIDLDAADIWMPLGLGALGRGKTPWWQNQNFNGLSIIARPAAGVDERELEQRITAALRDPAIRYMTADSNTIARFGSIVEANGPGKRSQEQLIAVRLAGVAVIVLLIACANVVNLLLSRAVKRRREIAVRLALGISRARLLRLLLAECTVLAVAAAGVAVIVAYVGGLVLRKLLLPDVHWSRSPLDWSVVLLALVVSSVAGVLAGLLPALQAATSNMTHALKAGSGAGVIQHSRLRNSLVVAQAALSVVLLVGAMLFVRSLSNVRATNIGFDAKRVMTATATYDDRLRTSDPTLPSRLTELATRMRSLPGVEAVALTDMSPMAGFSWMTYFTETDSVAGSSEWFPTATRVSHGYFDASGIHLVHGRDFPEWSGRAPLEVIVDQTMAKGAWPGRDPIGKCMRFETRNAPCYRVVGVVENSRMDKVIEKPSPKYYLPVDMTPGKIDGISRNPCCVIVRGDPKRTGELTAITRVLIRHEFPGSIPSITWLSDTLEPQYRPWQLGATLFTAFGMLALVVAIVGIYSTVSYGVTQRIHEFGVRIALGAQLRDVLRLVVGEGLRTIALGIAFGIVLAALGGRFIASLLYGVSPGDPMAIAVVVVTLLVVGAAAEFIPAWRAARVDPVTALRAD